MPRDLHFERHSPMPASAAELFDWHARPGAFARLAPPWERVEIVGDAPRLIDGSRAVLRMAKGPIRFRWVAEHRNVRPGRGFRDVQIKGPFALWEHDHLFETEPGGGSVLRDRIRFRPPAGALGRWLMESSLRRDLDRMFRYRHATTSADLALHARFAGRPRLRVAVTGAGGLVGRVLTGLLTTGGHEVVRLARPATRGSGRPGAVLWDPERGLLDPAALGDVDAVVHLAGESIAGGRWTARRKQSIRDSRVRGTRNLVASLGRLERPPRTLVCASAVGFYGNRGEAEVDESDGGGDGFLAEVCAAWEEAARAGRELGMRVALARFGVVLSPAGGLLARLLTPFRLGLGGPIGDGRQRMSWISVDDAASALLHLLLRGDLDGPFNLTAPQAPSNRRFSRVLAGRLGRPALLTLPAAMARALFGEMADELMLGGVAACPRRLLDDGFAFRHPGLPEALSHLLGVSRDRDDS